jgi:hypothetical protein
MSDALHHAFAYYPAALAAVAALGLVAITAWRPAVGCGIFAFSISLTTGLGRGTLVPLLKPNEAILLVFLVGLLVHYLPQRKRWPLTRLDLAIGGYTVGVVVISFLVLFVSESPYLFNVDTLRAVLSPLQFLVVYLVFSRVELSSRAVRAVLNLTMLASLFVGLLAAAQLANLPGARDFVATYYTPLANLQTSWDPGYRPTSTLGHYSAVGAFAAINFTLALALSTMRHPDFPRLWLSLVMAVNLAGLVSSLTWAPLIVLPLLVVLVMWYGRHVPRQLGITLLALAVAFVLFWPAISGRGAVQGVLNGAGQELAIPTTFAYRMRVWEAFFVPALADHVWLGNGTVIPSDVPTPLTNFVDNEYLREGFRAGIVGIALLVLMLASIGVVGWRQRGSPDPLQRSLGATSLAMVVFFPLVGITAEYMFFAGVSQEFAMLIGLLGAGAARAAQEMAPRLLTARRPLASAA